VITVYGFTAFCRPLVRCNPHPLLGIGPPHRRPELPAFRLLSLLADFLATPCPGAVVATPPSQRNGQAALRYFAKRSVEAIFLGWIISPSSGDQHAPLRHSGSRHPLAASCGQRRRGRFRSLRRGPVRAGKRLMPALAELGSGSSAAWADPPSRPPGFTAGVPTWAGHPAT